MNPEKKKQIKPRFNKSKRRQIIKPISFEKPLNINDDSACEVESTHYKTKNSDVVAEGLTTLIQYDENLLERARMQWQFGDWVSLARLDCENLQDHPDRSKLVLLAAAGHIQLGAIRQANKYLRMAHDWGCDTGLISQILIAGTHNSIGRAYAVLGQTERAVQHIKLAIEAGTPGADTNLLLPIRMKTQCDQPEEN